MQHKIAGENDDVFDDFSDLIRDVINEMGYNIEEQELQEIEKDLRLLEENADDIDPQLFSCLLDKFDDFPSFISDPEQSLQQLANKLETPDQGRKAQKQEVKLPREFDELITHGYMRLQEVYEGIKHYERLIEGNEESEQHDNPGTSGDGMVVEKPTGGIESQPKRQLPLISTSERRQKTDEKENFRPVVASLGKLDPREETRVLNQFLKKNALRRTQCPEPGRLPFKHDQQLRLEQYRREWTKNPPLGEQKRMALRWRIRELMTRREIPQLRILTTECTNIEHESQCQNEDQQGH